MAIKTTTNNTDSRASIASVRPMKPSNRSQDDSPIVLCHLRNRVPMRMILYIACARLDARCPPIRIKQKTTMNYADIIRDIALVVIAGSIVVLMFGPLLLLALHRRP